MSEFKKQYPFDKRVVVANNILTKYPMRLPVILDKAPNTLHTCTKVKFLVPNDISVGALIQYFKKYMPTLDARDSIFLFVGDVIPPTSSSILTIYNKYKDDDGFLYITYSGENVFG